MCPPELHLLKPVLSANISNLAVYSSAIMPIVIFRVCSWAQAVLSQSGSPKVLSMLGSNSARVANVEVYDKITLVSFSAQTCGIPPCIKERAYRIFILSSTNVSSCMVMAMWIDWTNCSALSLLPSKYSRSVSELCRWGYRCSSVFGRRLQLVHCAYLLTLSKYFGVGRTFGVWVKSDTSLRSGGGNEARQGSAYRWLKSCGRGNKLLK